MSEMINKLSQEVNNRVTESMSDVQDYVNITLQKEYYRCGYECFNRSKGEIQRCVERCAAPVQRAGAILDSELNKFQATTITLFSFKTLPCASKPSSSSSSQKLLFFCSSNGFHSCTSSCTL
jgi:hypothetical protein